MAEKLNIEQQRAVAHDEGPLLVVAGAGTGKTRVITERIARLIQDKKALSSEIVALTFTEKAAEEMQQRVHELLGRYDFDLRINTFNSFGDQLLRRFAYDIGLHHDLYLLTDTQKIVFLREHLAELKLDYFAPVTGPDRLLSEVSAHFSKLKNEVIKPAAYIQFGQAAKKAARDEAAVLEAKRTLELGHAYEIYLSLCRKHNFIDLDDQIYLTLELFDHRPNILEKVCSEIKYVLVDEFQDTNRAQGLLIDKLVQQSQNVMVVGDDDQSIYGFRGAALANILDFKLRYPKATQLSLVRNYRSSQEILDAAHRLISHNDPDRLEARYGIDKQLVGEFKGSKPHIQEFNSLEEEAAWLASDIKKRLARGESPQEIAIITRKNSQANILKPHLRAAEIDFHVVGSREDLYEQADIKFLLDYLRFLADPQDQKALYRVLVSPFYNVDSLFLRRMVAESERQYTELESILRESAVSEGLESFFTTLDDIRTTITSLSVGQLLYRFFEQTGYIKTLVNNEKNDPSISYRLAHINQFFGKLLEFERIAEDATIVGFIQDLPALIGAGEPAMVDLDLSDFYGNNIRIITAHKAKGLEFDTVYLFDVTQGTFPTYNRGAGLEVPAQLKTDDLLTTSNIHLQEERRLMYVAMTRARKKLAVTWSPFHGGRELKKPSIFIEEAFGITFRDKQQKAKTLLNQPELFAETTVRGLEYIELFLENGQLKLNPHQIETYLQCPAEFKLRYILKPPVPPSFAVAYGVVVHGAIQLYYKLSEAGPVDFEALREYLETHWPAEGFLYKEQKDQSLKEAVRSLRRFYDREQKQRRTPKYIERPFHFTHPEGGVLISGRLDAVFEDVNGVEIRDFKTGASTVVDQAKADQRAKDSFQLGIYALAWRELHGSLPESVTLDFVDVGLVGRAHKTARQIQTVEDKIVRCAQGIRKGDFNPSNNHLFCSHQEYGF